MRTRDQIIEQLEAIRRVHARAYGDVVYDDGQLEALLYVMAREKLQISLRSSLQSYDVDDLVQAILILKDLKTTKKGKK